MAFKFLMNDNTEIDLLEAQLIDAVGHESDTYRVYKTITGRKVLLRQKGQKQEWSSFDNPDGETLAQMNLKRTLREGEGKKPKKTKPLGEG